MGKRKSLKAYEVGTKGAEWRQTIHALSAGKAKYEFYLGMRDAGWDVEFKDLTCKSLGAPRDTQKFRHTANYRGVEFNIGDTVRIGKYGEGQIKDSDSSANFQVAMLSGKWAGQTIHVHPSEIEFPAGGGGGTMGETRTRIVYEAVARNRSQRGPARNQGERW